VRFSVNLLGATVGKSARFSIGFLDRQELRRYPRAGVGNRAGGGVLRLNIGDYASARVVADYIGIEREIYTITQSAGQIYVSAFDRRSGPFDNITLITGDAGPATTWSTFNRCERGGHDLRRCG